jgi:hypothetical protein
MSRGRHDRPDRGGAPRGTRREARGETGAVTAETALVLPLLVALTLAMVWLASVGLTQMRVTDAAREVARALARGDPPGSATALAEVVAPGSRVEVVEQADGTVLVRVTRPLHPPGGLLDALPAGEASATATALLEEP